MLLQDVDVFCPRYCLKYTLLYIFADDQTVIARTKEELEYITRKRIEKNMRHAEYSLKISRPFTMPYLIPNHQFHS